MTEPILYTVGGTVQAGGGFYIKRKADDDLLKYCRASEFAFILSSRQVGKSSLMVRTAQQLEKEGIRSVIIDLSSFGVKISAEEWFLGILNEVSNTLNLQTDIFSWWSERSALGPAQRLTMFFRDVLLKEVSVPVVLFFDEIDSTLSIPFSDDFFAALRSIYNARSTTPEFKRLSFVMIGVATPSDLIADSSRTPFNIGYRVDLTDFTFEEALPLAGSLGPQTLHWILNWTGGHPYLTQRLCEYISKNQTEYTEASVADAVKKIYEGEQGKQDNNLQFVRDMLTKRSPDIQRVMKTYKDIRSGHVVPDDERSIPKSHLKIAGIVRRAEENLRTRNRIYEQTFDLAWIRKNTPSTTVRKVTWVFSVITMITLMVAGYFAWENYTRTPLEWAAKYTSDFQAATSAEAQLKNLAGLFSLNESAYDDDALILFSNMTIENKMALFAPSDSPKVRGYQEVVVTGLYMHLPNTEENNQLLEAMSKVAPSVKSEIEHWVKGRRLISQGNYESAVEELTYAIGANGNNPSTYYDRAIAYVRWGEGYYSKARSDLDKMMNLDPSRGLAAYLLINSTTTRGKASLYASDIQTTQNPEVRLQSLVGLIELDGGAYRAKAVELFLNLGQDDKLALFDQSKLQGVEELQEVLIRATYTNLKNFVDDNEVLIKMAKAVPSYREEIDLWIEGRGQLVTKDPSGAVETLTKAIKINGKNPALYYDRAQAYVNLGSEEGYRNALLDLNTMVQVDPSWQNDASLFLNSAPISEYWAQHSSESEYSKLVILPRATGIDVSYWDGDIDWKSVKDFGIDFVFMKATEGDFYKDPTYKDRLVQINAVQIPSSAYHFFRANTDPIVQAELYLEVVKSSNADLPPILDIEFNDGRTKEEIMAGAKIWLDIVEQGLGQKPIIYSPANFLKEYFSDQSGYPPVWAEEYHLWYAQYLQTFVEGMDPQSLPDGWEENWDFWQYTDGGSVPGINSTVDMNVFNGSEAELQQYIATVASSFEGTAQQKTITDLTMPLDENPYDAQAFVIRGIAYFIYQQYDLAIADFSSSIEITPTAQAYAKRGSAYFAIENYELAIADFTKAIDLGTQDANIYLERGRAYEALGMRAEAAADYDTYTQLTGSSPNP